MLTPLLHAHTLSVQTCIHLHCPSLYANKEVKTPRPDRITKKGRIWILVFANSSYLQASGSGKAAPLALGVEPEKIRMETCKENMKRNHWGVYSPLLEEEMLQAACWSQIKTYELQLSVCLWVFLDFVFWQKTWYHAVFWWHIYSKPLPGRSHFNK